LLRIQAQATRKKPQEVASLRTQKDVLARALLLGCTVLVRRGRTNLSVVFAFVSCEGKDYYLVVSDKQFGFDFARTGCRRSLLMHALQF